MTHEAGIEAAVSAFEAAEMNYENTVEDLVQGIVEAYLSASDMILVARHTSECGAHTSNLPNPFKSKP